MKRAYFAACMGLILLNGCMTEETDFSSGVKSLTAVLEKEAETKVSFDSADGKLAWNTGDKIAVYVGDRFVEAEVNPSDGRFSVTETKTSHRDYYAIYPSTAADASHYGNATLNVKLPDSYDISGIVAGTSSAGLTADYAPVPMVAVNHPDQSILQFLHVGGLLRINCGRVPAGVKTIKVTLDKNITGTYPVNEPDSDAPNIQSEEGDAAGNTVVYTVSSSGLALQTDIVLNIPVPCGTYSDISVASYDTADASGTPISENNATEGHTFERHHGWKAPLDIAEYHFTVVGPDSSLEGYASSSTYQVESSLVQNGTATGVGWTATFSVDDGLTWDPSNRPSWLTAFTLSNPEGDPSLTSYELAVSDNDTSTPYSWDDKTKKFSNSNITSAVNLCTKDIWGNAIGKSTANCYIVSEPGYYKFPCIYGNGFKDGRKNDPAFMTTGIVNHLDKDLIRRDASGNPLADQNPYIQNHLGSGLFNSDGSVNTSRLKAVIMWQDCDGQVSDVSLSRETHTDLGEYGCLYINFKVNDWKQGNAVIALTLDDVVVWSWHIWSVERAKLTTTRIYTHPTIHPSVVAYNETLDMNLGWHDAARVMKPRSVLVKLTQDITGKSETFTIFQMPGAGFGGNVFYQWGRKDPMLGFDENFVERTQYNYTEETKFKIVNPGKTIGYAIQHPNEFYTSPGTSNREKAGSWCPDSDMSDVFWNVNGVFDTDVEVVKTIYDPSPIGFKVPNRNAYTGFVADPTAETHRGAPNKLSKWQMGYLFKASESDTEGVFFPATSLRESNTGAVRLVWGSGLYWTASRNTHVSGYVDGVYVGGYRNAGVYLEFRGSYPNNPNEWTAAMNNAGLSTFGFSVRPVRE